MNACQLGQHERVFRIHRQGRFEQGSSLVQLTQLSERRGDPLIHTVVFAGSAIEFFEVNASLMRLFFQQRLADAKPFHQQRAAMGQFEPLALLE